MSDNKRSQGGDVFIIDNSDKDWKVRRYLHDWADLAHKMDIATGYFEIGGLLALDGQWQKVDKFRVLMGDEVTRRTKKAVTEAITVARAALDDSIEREKETNDFLSGVPAVVEGIRSGKIECRVYTKDKFHAKAFITHGRHAVVGSVALVGSSNFTYPGITDNVELNVQIRNEVEQLQAWYERHWQDAQDITPEILRVIERHTRDYTPFEVYVKALQEYCRGHEPTAQEWEQGGEGRGSRMFPILDQYQQEGYRALMQIARRYGGAFLCDGVGLGKTFVGLMLIERLIMHEGKRVALFAPKTAVDDVWRPHIREYLKHVGSGDFSSLAVFNQTDLGRGGDYPERLARIRELADAVVIDEAHHFRNPGRKGDEETGGAPSRYRELFELIDGPRGRKEVFLLTATPINNRLHDFRHMAELFTRKQDDYFAKSIGVHSLRGHFIKMEKDLLRAVARSEAAETNLAEAEQILAADKLFKELVVQRSRAYVRKSQLQQGGSVANFPEREPPRVAEYSAKTTYGRLLDMVDKAFHQEEPLFVLGIYYPLAYVRTGEDVDPWEANRQKQVCALIRTQFLKRFESSAYAFEQSCNRLLIKLLAWVTRHSATESEKRRLELWKHKHADLIGYVHERQMELFPEHDEDEADDDLITDEMLESVELLDRKLYNVEDILADTYEDLNGIAEFLDELQKFQPKHDDKLKALIKLLKTDPVLKRHKVLIFSEFAETARYLQDQLMENGVTGVEQIDSGSKKNRREIIRRFAPYYNGTSSNGLAEHGLSEIRVLISTDVLSEGLNLQDATRMINYDLHWNPVRLMQRIGRVDRRMNPKVEKQLLADHPDRAPLRGKIVYWNFLPPGELETLLSLYNRVSHKTLRISRTLGIEGKKLLRPEDDYDALKDLNHSIDGETTSDEEMRLELQRLLEADPQLAGRIDALPGRVFSGKRHVTEGCRAVFFCYRLPRPDHTSGGADEAELPWTEAAGETRWYLYDLDQQKIHEEPAEIIGLIRSLPDTPRHCAIEQPTLADVRKQIEKHIKNTFLKRMQAPVGVKPTFKAWMELN